MAWSIAAVAQTPGFAGTQVIVPAQGEVRHANDEAVLTFLVEEQDKDKGAAASRVNLKMKQGMDIVKREDSSAQLKTRGYYTFPVYSEQPTAKGLGNLQPIAWRVGQQLEVTTKNLSGLPKMVAAAQRTLAVSSLNFGLSKASLKTLDEQRIAAVYEHLKERMASIAKAMGRPIAEAIIVSIDLDGAGNHGPGPSSVMMSSANMRVKDVQGSVEEPSFDPGETTLQMQLVAKVLFK